MEKNILKLLNKDIIFFDGGFGTQLIKRLGKPQQSPFENLLHPETVLAIHNDYAAAGSDILTANTFGAYDPSLYDIDKAVKTGVELCRQAAAAQNRRILTALDVGSLGEMIEPYGDLSEQEAAAKFERLMSAGQDADIILIETMYDIAEAALALAAAQNICPDKPVLLTMTFDSGGRTFMGASIKNLTELAGKYGVSAAGFNCGLGPKAVADFIDEFKKYSNIPVMTQPNAGLPKVIDGVTTYDLSAEIFAGEMSILYKHGAKVLGGCCGTTPEHIEKLCKALKAL